MKLTPDDDEAMSEALANLAFDLYVIPELARRNRDLDRSKVTQVVVEINPDRKYPRVSINDEAEIVAMVRARRPILKGEEVSLDDISEIFGIEPRSVSPNSGFICFATINGKHSVRYDFRYNKARAKALITRAREFLTVAQNAQADAPAVACDVAFSAAELSVQARMMLQDQKTKSHWKRQEWLDAWTENGNAPSTQARILRELHEHRSTGRYADAELELNPENLQELLDEVASMIDDAEHAAT